MDKNTITRRSFLFLTGAAISQGINILPARSTQNKITTRRGAFNKIPFYRTTIDLKDAHTFLAIGLANNPTLGNHKGINGDEDFKNMVKRYHAAAIVNGTYFGTKNPSRVLGNIISGGVMLQRNSLRNWGTTLAIDADNKPDIITGRVDGTPNWDRYWLSLTAGPRLLRKGKVWLAPRTEGFKDPRVMGVAPRVAIGFPASGNPLIIVTFLKSVSLWDEAKIMRAIGCSEALNLDGGSSSALYDRGKILVTPKRKLTNVIVAYDAKNPAPKFLKNAWDRFRENSFGY
ncbi:MAG: phosphodiester glycosidase family protein [Prochloraceae cyanobacterium]